MSKEKPPMTTRKLVSHLSDFINENPKTWKEIKENALHPPKATLKTVAEACESTDWSFVNSLNP